MNQSINPPSKTPFEMEAQVFQAGDEISLDGGETFERVKSITKSKSGRVYIRVSAGSTHAFAAEHKLLTRTE